MGIMRASALAFVVAFGCKQADKKAVEHTPSGPTAAAGDAAGAAEPSRPAATAVTEQAGARQLEAPPPPKLHDAPVERRLYSDRIEASSFLWTNWNKFQENYHPNYILDGDPATAWVEGADGSGRGEWVRIHVSPVESASKIRIRIRNGYHKSKPLHAKNARLKKLELVALPSGTTHAAELADDMSWQELSFEQPTGKLEAIELRALDVVEGSAYTDLCVSDVELYVTGLTVENPAFEKSKLDALLAWKQKRLQTAKLLGGAGAKGLPIQAGYRVIRGDTVSFDTANDGKPYRDLRATLAALAPRAARAPTYADAAARATAALETKFAGWVRVQAIARNPIELPDVDGLRAAENEEIVYGAPEDTFLLPSSDQGILVRSGHLSTFDTKGDNPIDDTDCEKDTSAFMRSPRKAEDGPIVREILHVRCVSEETREGEATYMTWQLLEFDADGNLVLTAGPRDQVQWFEWKHGASGSVLTGGGRLDSAGDKLLTLVAAETVAKN